MNGAKKIQKIISVSSFFVEYKMARSPLGCKHNGTEGVYKSVSTENVISLTCAFIFYLLVRKEDPQVPIECPSMYVECPLGKTLENYRTC